MRSLSFSFTMIFAFTATFVSGQCGLFFSEYAEGSSNNKYLEIYNPTGLEISLDGYAFPSVSNAPETPGEYEYWNTFTEGATIAAGGVYIIAHGSSDPSILAFANQTHNYLSNGDDGYALVQGDETDYSILDIIGTWDEDPGSGWEVAGVSNGTKDHTLVRKSDVNSGVGYDWALAAGTNADDSQWIVLEQNDWTYLGSHDWTGTCGAAVLGCTNANATNYDETATEDDGSCAFDNACNVDGTVVTTTSFIYSPADLSIEPGTTVIWENIQGFHNANGTTNSITGESFMNPEDFFFDAVSGSAEGTCIGSHTFDIPGVYAYDCSIGNHAVQGMVGTITVGQGGCMQPAAPNYNEAADYDDGTCLEVTMTSIATIQQGQLTDAYTGQTVVTSGVITGVFGNLVSMQDGQGEYSGIWMFGPNVPVSVGNPVEVTGTVAEYNGLTQLTNVSIIITGPDTDLPTAELLSTAAVSNEAWEGVLVQVTGDVSNEDLGYGEWGVDDDSGQCVVDDRGYDVIETGFVLLGNTWQVTGPLDYNYGAFKIQPRSEADALLYGCTNSGASNYNTAAGIDDGTCEYTGEACSIFFSEYAEGSSNNKYLEIYNPTASTVFLSQYTLGNCSNGCDNPEDPYLTNQFDYFTFNFPFDATIAPGGTYIIANGSADQIILGAADMTYQYLSNGDDAYGLFELTATDTVLVDLIGEIGPDPGDGWEVGGIVDATKDHTLVRKEYVFAGNGGDWAMSAGTNAIDSEWIVLDMDDFSDLTMHSFSGGCSASTAGCTDSFAVNYDLNATEDDGSCIYINNYTIQEIQSGGLGGQMQTSGIVTAVYEGDYAFGYEPSFVIQDGNGPYSAIWVVGAGVAMGDELSILGNVSEVYGLRQIQGVSFEILSSGNELPAAEMLATYGINEEQWECVLIAMTGECVNPDASYGEWLLDDGSGIGVVDDIGYSAIDDSLTNDGETYVPLVEQGRDYRVTGPNLYAFGDWRLLPRDNADVVRLGCTDPVFSNYDAYAQEDNGSCIDSPGCMNPEADNYDAEATIDDGSCVISGCDDSSALNYQEGVTNPTNETCYYTLPNMVINEIHYNPCVAQTEDDLDFEFIEVYVSNDMAVDLGGFEFYNSASGEPQLGYVFPAGTTVMPGEYFLMTVSDESTANYSGLGVQVFQMVLGNFSNGGESVSLEDGFGNIIDEVTYSDSGAWPQTVQILGNALIQSPDGGCSTLELIQTDLNNDNPSNWQASWVDNGTPGAPNSSAFGCTDGTACNYASGAFFDDDSCDFSCYGCTYEDAANYDNSATMDSGLCEFDFVDNCPADINEDGLVSTVDLLEFLASFGSACPE